MGNVLMMCGHAADGYATSGWPVCVTCYPAIESQVEDQRTIDLTGRRAKCAYHHNENDTVESSFNLPFFEFRGEGSRDSKWHCKHCFYYEPVHDPNYSHYKPLDHEFEAHGAFEYDRYYCGCRGWD